MTLVAAIALQNRSAEAAAPPAKEGPHIRVTPIEGRGLKGLEIGDPVEQIEKVLGEAEGGDDTSYWYRSSGMDVTFRDGKVLSFHFLKAFRGKLQTSGLGIGASIDEVEKAYGAVKENREVKDLTQWHLDRVLVYLPGDPPWNGGPVMKLYYRDAGLTFWFDEADRVRGFSIVLRTDYAQPKKDDSRG